jgi:hypothetical protein
MVESLRRQMSSSSGSQANLSRGGPRILGEVLGPPQQVANASLGGLAQGGGQLNPRM